MSTVYARYPARPVLNRLVLSALDQPATDWVVRGRVVPSEAYAVWDRWKPGFSATCRDLGREDVSVTSKSRIREDLSIALPPRRRRLLLKFTGWPRIGFLKEIFPDARFVQLVRDGRAVAFSLTVRPWWRGWEGPGRWCWGDLTPAQRDRWEAADRSFEVLAGIEWEILMDALAEGTRLLSPTEMLVVRFEELCRDTHETLDRILGFAGLRWTERLERTVAAVRYRNTNDRWRSELTPTRRRQLDRSLGGALLKYGYEADLAS